MWFRSLLIVSVGVLFLLDVNEATAEWVYVKKRDEFTDRISHRAGTYGTRQELLLVSCREGNLYVTVREVNLSFRVDDFVEVQYRFDTTPGKKSTWIYENRQAWLYHYFYPPSGLENIKKSNIPSGFLEQLMAHNNMIIKIEDGDMMQFNLKGSRAAIEKVIAACKL